MDIINDPSNLGQKPSPPQGFYHSEKRVLAGILGLVTGGLGLHKFYLGYTQEGILQIVITIVTCGLGSVIGFIGGILYLTKSDEEFDRTYVNAKRPWF